jgi:Type II secretion system (T2SS), protein E, N-terminal domain
MPVLAAKAAAWPVGGKTEGERGEVRSVLPVCGNARCRTSWLRLWWKRQTPRFEGAWACGPLCLEEMVRGAVGREADESAQGCERAHHHRIPLGLMLLAQGVVTREQLRAALAAQAAQQPARRIGRWLIQQQLLSEAQLTLALSRQWNCPVFSGERLLATQAALLLPRLFIESYGVLPLRRTAGGRILVACEDHLDPCVNLALERMHAAPVEAGILPAVEFRSVRQQLLAARFPRLRLLEVAGHAALVRALAARLEAFQPLASQLVRVRDCFWLRMWKGLDRADGEAEDVVAMPPGVR